MAVLAIGGDVGSRDANATTCSPIHLPSRPLLFAISFRTHREGISLYDAWLGVIKRDLTLILRSEWILNPVRLYERWIRLQ
jgi:hypothetical protein